MDNKESRIELKPITMDDTHLIIKWRNNENVRRNFLFQETFTEEIHTNWMKTKVATGEVEQFIIKTKENNKSIGSIYLRDIDYEKKEAEFGIFIGEDDERGKGYGREALKLIIDYGFNELKLDTIFGRVLPHNEHALKTYQNVGFAIERYEKNVVKIKGEDSDIIFVRINKNIPLQN